MFSFESPHERPLPPKLEFMSEDHESLEHLFSAMYEELRRLAVAAEFEVPLGYLEPVVRVRETHHTFHGAELTRKDPGTHGIHARPERHDVNVAARQHLSFFRREECLRLADRLDPSYKE